MSKDAKPKKQKLKKVEPRRRLTLGQTMKLFREAEQYGRIPEILNCSAQSVSNWKKYGITTSWATLLREALKNFERSHPAVKPLRKLVPAYASNYWAVWSHVRGLAPVERLLALELASIASTQQFGAHTIAKFDDLEKNTGLEVNDVIGTAMKLEKVGVIKNLHIYHGSYRDRTDGMSFCLSAIDQNKKTNR